MMGGRRRIRWAAAGVGLLFLCAAAGVIVGYRLGDAGGSPATATVAPDAARRTNGDGSSTVALADARAQRQQIDLVVAGLVAAAAGRPLPAELSLAVQERIRAALRAPASAANNTEFRATALFLDPVDWRPDDPRRSGEDPATRATWRGQFRGEVTVREETPEGTPVAAPITRHVRPEVHELTVRLARQGERWVVIDVAGALVGTF